MRTVWTPGQYVVDSQDDLRVRRFKSHEHKSRAIMASNTVLVGIRRNTPRHTLTAHSSAKIFDHSSIPLSNIRSNHLSKYTIHRTLCPPYPLIHDIDFPQEFAMALPPLHTEQHDARGLQIPDDIVKYSSCLKSGPEAFWSYNQFYVKVRSLGDTLDMLSVIPDHHFCLIQSLCLDFGWHSPSGFLRDDICEDGVSGICSQSPPGVIPVVQEPHQLIQEVLRRGIKDLQLSFSGLLLCQFLLSGDVHGKRMNKDMLISDGGETFCSV